MHSTGEIPTETTVYKYLNGRITIRIELISYIAEALRLTEQDLFTNNNKSRKKFFSTIIKTATQDEMKILKEKLELSNQLINFVSEPTINNTDTNSIKNELISLLPYAPIPLQLSIINKLKDIKEFTSSL